MRKIISILPAILFATLLHADITFRGAWIATVANIDWPSATDIPSAQNGYTPNITGQQRTMTELLDSLQAIGINTIIFQARPTADALYLSPLEPSSHWQAGRQGAMPGYDVLRFVLDEAHARDMQVHVWLNPYRITLHTMDTAMLAPGHIMRQHPDWCWRYGKQWYFDPGREEVIQWICDVVEDLVCRYDVDAVHMDDYFYPYPIGRQRLPDHNTFRAFPRGFENIDEWRRDNVNRVIRRLSEVIHTTRPGTEFGISPFGVWRNAAVDSVMGSATQAGITNYDDLYADVLLWMREGWIDYVVPQLYWEIGKAVADYEVLAHWWADHSYGCKLYIGMAPYRLGGPKEAAAWKKGNEIARQMRLNRTIPEITGECFYSTRPLLLNPLGVCDSIRQFYRTAAEESKTQP
ncbi:MAG: family 10 glycosylhydrolase [Paludibacteraceae bacterium]|nr:family 10 glycosylhydrolase [Paludibacteraceae bacterium]